MAIIGVSIIVNTCIPHCPTVRNTNDDKILKTPHFQKIDKMKNCGYVSI